MIIEGYVAKGAYRDVDMYLSGTKWVDDIMKLKISDIKDTPHDLNMEDWPMMDKKYENAKITIDIKI